MIPVPRLSRLAALLLAISSAAAAPPEFYLQSKAPIAGANHASEAMPSDADLAKADAVLITNGSWTAEESARIKAYVEKGGGVVLVHDAITGSPWAKGEIKRWAGTVPLFFTPPGREDAITKGISNFDVEDEMFHGTEPEKGAKVLATTWSPNKKHLKGTDPQPYVYGVSPMVWSQEAGKGRIVFFVPGKNAETLSHPAIHVMLRRALSWAAKRENVDEFNAKDDLATLTYPPGGPLAPEKSLETLKVHPDFKVNLVAAEPLISKPLNIDWDAKGRLWVVESLEYPEGKEGGGPESMYSVWERDTNLPKPAPVNRPGRDRIAMLEDTNGDGIMDSKKVFAEDLDLATTFCFYRDGVIVAQPPEILFLGDADHDGRVESRTVLYTGLGTFDRHSVINNFRWGLDGWVYATHGYSSSRKVTSGDGSKDFGAIGSGIVRFKPDGSAIEMVSAKSGNCWGVDMTTDGELVFTQPTSGDLVMHVPVSDRIMAEGGLGREPSWQVMVHLRPVKPLMSWEEIVENQPNDVIGSFTAACGCAVYEGGAWPDAWKMGYFTAEPTVHIIHHEALTPDGVTYSAAKTREEEFSATRDFWTRPIDTRVGPDGQLYVIDFYNQAILHNDPRGPIHLWYNQAARPDRDHYFGRILRYSNKDSKPLPKSDLTSLDGQLAALSHPNRDIRFRAQRLIEEGDVKAAANRLADAKGLSRLHALWIRAAAGVLKPEELVAAMEDPDMALRVTAGRVIGAHPELATDPVLAQLARRLPQETEARVRLQWLAGLPADAALPAETLVALQARAGERWTQAAIARLARKQPAQVLAAALAAGASEKQAPLAAQLFDAFSGDATVLPAMLEAIAKAGEKSPEIAVASLASLRGRKLPGGANLAVAMEKLAASPSPRIAAAALPLVVSPDAQSVRRILAAAPGDTQVLVSLGTLPLMPTELLAALKDGLTRESPQRGAILDAVLGNASPEATKLVIAVLPSLSATDKARAIESLLGRRESAIALSDALNEGTLSVQITGTPVLARLADHPDASVKEHAAPMLKRLRGAVEAKDAVIARLLPEVSKPGNPETGKALFAACAVCHNFRGEGALIGPVLEGIGVHSPEVLLTHIVDPNREVEPSYHVWNISTTDGRTLSGFVSRETDGSLFIKSAAGETEIPRAQIASRTDTGKSLMPEGFEGLGADTLRDLIAYLRSGEQRFHTLPFGKAATADGSRGVYLSRETEGDRVTLKKYGLVEERGVPFQLQDPATAPDGKNVIVLKGGMDPRAVSKTMPQRVEIPVGFAAGRIHLLGAVAGWGFPAANDRDPLVEITIHYSGGTSEKIVLRNGIDFADHAMRIDVAGSAWTDLVSRGQIRYLWRDLKQPAATLEKIVLASADRPAAPMIAAITFESADKEGKMKPAPAEGGPLLGQFRPLPGGDGNEKFGTLSFSQETFVLPPNTLRVLMAGGGGSHDFAAWYDKEDRKILTEAGGLLPEYTSSPEVAAAALPSTDVFLFSANDPAYAKSAEFRKAFDAYVARGGGLVLLHPATWYNFADWPAYNTTFVGGGSRAHDPLGEFTLTVLKPEHPVVAGLSKEFKIRDEHYQINFEPGAQTTTLIETSVSAQTGKKHASVWITAHPKCRIVCIAPGHDEAAHRNPEFRKLLANAVKWAGGK